ncbi:hypothetical protein GHT06_009684 [Daphnia sinensis]|uniref:Uncharacterized protein n=1 Tax=Daphnia sinensis TaxID=1820382 RepID=A0AAD5LNA8_9CRUS|nr:hypothetical protein GHT06_009684 [Daphnia sinensis]
MAGIGGSSARKLTHSETIDGLSAPHISVYNQSMMGSSHSISAFPRTMLVIKSRRSWPVLPHQR